MRRLRRRDSEESTQERTQVAIVGVGPARLLLGALLHKAGIAPCAGPR